MSKIQVSLMRDTNFGDHGAMMRVAHEVKPDETVAELVDRLFGIGTYAVRFARQSSDADWIEIRLVQEPADPPTTTNPFDVDPPR